MPRPSPVRDAVRRVLSQHDRHAVTLEEIHAEVTSAGVSADPSSVFRAVAHLEAERAVQRVELGDGQARYEAPSAHHEHLRCTGCGTVTPVSGCLLSRGVAAAAAREGFTVDGHVLVLTGRCAECAA